MRLDLTELCAKTLMGRPEAHMAKIEMLNDDDDGFDGVRIEICDAPAVVQGKRAGKPNWRRSTNRQVRLISYDALRAQAEVWSEDTGKCIDCAGTGEIWMGWSEAEGTKTRPCADCAGTGYLDCVPRAPEPVQPTLFTAPVREWRGWVQTAGGHVKGDWTITPAAGRGLFTLTGPGPNGPRVWTGVNMREADIIHREMTRKAPTS